MLTGEWGSICVKHVWNPACIYSPQEQSAFGMTAYLWTSCENSVISTDAKLYLGAQVTLVDFFLFIFFCVCYYQHSCTLSVYRVALGCWVEAFLFLSMEFWAKKQNLSPPKHGVFSQKNLSQHYSHVSLLHVEYYTLRFWNGGSAPILKN